MPDTNTNPSINNLIIYYDPIYEKQIYHNRSSAYPKLFFESVNRTFKSTLKKTRPLRFLQYQIT